MNRKALGRGLDALIPGAQSPATAVAAPSGGSTEISIAEIGPNPFQPRKRFDDEALKELADSIKVSGVLQPLIVRASGEDGYQLVAGERRLRASSLAGLKKVPCIVREVPDKEMLELAIIENVQREDLNPIEEARAYQALIDEIKLTHDEVAERVGKRRVTITNALRLLQLPPEVREMVSRGTLSAGHARAILALDNAGDQLTAARYVQAKGLSVRRTEMYVRKRSRKTRSRQQPKGEHGMREWETKLQQRFGTHVAIRPGRRGGKIEFEYYGQEDLERLFEVWGIL